jgi:hypothetical protein
MYRQKLREISRQSRFPIDEFGADHFVLTQEAVGELRQLDYFDQWLMALRQNWFHIKMADGSLFIFKEGRLPAYSYMHCPLDIVTFADFLNDIGEIDCPQVRREFRAQYEQLLETASRKLHVTPIRFDFDPSGYRPGVHPAAHIHIGLLNPIRIAANKMSAASFVLFVMRQMYPESWACLLEKSNCDYFVRCIRDGSTLLPPEYQTELDAIELHLS